MGLVSHALSLTVPPVCRHRVFLFPVISSVHRPRPLIFFRSARCSLLCSATTKLPMLEQHIATAPEVDGMHSNLRERTSCSQLATTTVVRVRFLGHLCVGCPERAVLPRRAERRRPLLD